MTSTAALHPVDIAKHAMSGLLPRQAWRPENAREVADALRQCAADGLGVVPWGGGIALARSEAPARYDVALDLGALNRITIHDPEDFTITAGCGITIADLGAALAAKQQELPLEAAESWGATLGGVLAANASGPRRRAFGSPRDRLLGARFVTGDGVLAKTGGRVVKNVAGHAVHRLLVGSRGTLAVFVEASLKLLPQPPARAAMVWPADAAALADSHRWQEWPRREPVALTVIGRAVAGVHPVLGSEAPFAIVAGFEDDAAWVEACGEFAHRTLGAARVKVQGASVPPLWQQIADMEEIPGVRLTFTTAANTPAAIAFLAGRPVAERLVFHAPCGRLHVWPQPDESAALAGDLERHGFVRIDVRGAALPSAGPGPALAAMRARIREALDPRGIFALG